MTLTYGAPLHTDTNKDKAMKKTAMKKLVISSHTIRNLTAPQLERAVGGASIICGSDLQSLPCPTQLRCPTQDCTADC